MSDLTWTSERAVIGKSPLWLERLFQSTYLWWAELGKGRRVLDAGCGTGYGTRILLEAGAESVHAIDVSSEAIQYAINRYGGPGISFRVGDLRKLSGGPYDLIVCFHVIEHIDETDEVLSEFYRVLAPYGKLVLGAPQRGVAAKNDFHVHDFDILEMAEILRGVGFEVKELWGQDGKGTCVPWTEADDRPRYWHIVAEK